MKNFGLLLLATLFIGLSACGDDDDPAAPQQEVTCTLTSPEDEAVVNLRETPVLKIKGDASVNVGKVESATLKVNGKAIAEVTNVPVDYDYTFAEDQAVGPFKVELTVKGDAGAVKTAKANITLIKTEQSVTCELTEPEADAEINIDDHPTLKIKGTASVNIGELSAVVLKLNGEVIPEVTTSPIDYEYTFKPTQAAGPFEIELTAKGSDGAEKKVTRTIILKRKEQVVTCELTAPANGTEIDLDQTNTLQISGKVAVNLGAIDSKKLTIGGKEVTPFPNVQSDGTFTYTHTFEASQPAGELIIELSAKGDRHEQADKTSVSITLKKAGEETGDTFTDARDGKIYKMVTIGTQTWMAENLAYLPEVHNPADVVPNYEKGDKHYFVYGYAGSDITTAKATKEYQKYGVLYNWDAAMNGAKATDANPSGVQGICPAGWHLPSEAEWKVLEEFVASKLPNVKGEGYFSDIDNIWTGYREDCKNVWGALAGGAWDETSMGGENPDLKKGPQNTYGMNIIPAGHTYKRADMYGEWFTFPNSSAEFWSTEYKDYGGGCTTFSNNDYRPNYSKNGSDERQGYSVRCVKD